MEFNLEPYLPYKGNKFGILEQIYHTIRGLNIPEPKGVIDAFTGGGSFAYFMARHGYKVIANDIDPSVIELHNTCQHRPDLIREWGKLYYTKEQFKQWLDVEGPQAALIRSIWSFGNDGKTYLTSTENEQNKIEEFLRGVAEPNSRFKHIEDICLLWSRYNLDLEFRCGSYDQIPVPEGWLGYCFTPDHEVLTKRGWVPFADIKENDYFLSREPNTGRLEYVKNTRVIKRPYKGKLYTYESKSVSLAVSLEHKLFVNRTHGREKQKCDEFITAADATNKNFCWVSAGGVWSGVKNPFFLNGKEVDKTKFARLLGIYLTDGHTNNQGGVHIGQKKPKTATILRSLLIELGIEYSEYNNGDFYIRKSHSYYFQQFARKEERRIPEEFKNADVETVRALLDGILDGDSDSERRKIYIGSKPLADDIMELCFKAGYAAKLKTIQPKAAFLKTESRWIVGKKPYYVISVLKTHYKTRVKAHESLQWYDGMLYCCTLEKWHTVLVRRNGKCIWCGQCDPPYRGTAGYRCGDFDHEAFYKWALAQPGLVLISEYSMPEGFFLVDEYFKWVESGRGARGKAGVERLYSNKPVKKLTLF